MTSLNRVLHREMCQSLQQLNSFQPTYSVRCVAWLRWWNQLQLQVQTLRCIMWYPGGTSSTCVPLVWTGLYSVYSCVPLVRTGSHSVCTCVPLMQTGLCMCATGIKLHKPVHVTAIFMSFKMVTVTLNTGQLWTTTYLAFFLEIGRAHV